jgi:hypothetical protein
LRYLFLKFQKSSFLVDKFAAKADKFDRWADEKSDVFNDSDFGHGVVGAEQSNNSHDI